MLSSLSVVVLFRSQLWTFWSFPVQPRSVPLRIVLIGLGHFLSSSSSGVVFWELAKNRNVHCRHHLVRSVGRRLYYINRIDMSYSKLFIFTSSGVSSLDILLNKHNCAWVFWYVISIPWNCQFFNPFFCVSMPCTIPTNQYYVFHSVILAWTAFAVHFFSSCHGLFSNRPCQPHTRFR